MANLTVLVDSTPHAADRLSWEADAVGMGVDVGQRPFVGCVAREGRPGRSCTYRTDLVRDMGQFGHLQRLFGDDPQNREALGALLRSVALSREVHGSTAPDIDGVSAKVTCPTVHGSDGQKHHMAVCGQWRRFDATGDEIRRLMRVYFGDKAPAVLADLAREFCSTHWLAGVEDCACINRAASADYNRIAGSDSALRAEDNCWYLPCKSGQALRDPDLGDNPCHLSVCQVVNNIEAAGNVSLDRTQIDMSGCMSSARPADPAPQAEPAPPRGDPVPHAGGAQPPPSGSRPVPQPGSATGGLMGWISAHPQLSALLAVGVSLLLALAVPSGSSAPRRQPGGKHRRATRGSRPR